jgi:hypothetical protein
MASRLQRQVVAFLRSADSNKLRLVSDDEVPLLDRLVGNDPDEAARDVIAVAEATLVGSERTFHLACGEVALDFQIAPARNASLVARVPLAVTRALGKLAHARNVSVSDLVLEAVVAHYKIDREKLETAVVTTRRNRTDTRRQ